MRRSVLPVLLLAILPLLLEAAAPAWPKGKVYAVSLTYDDGLESQIMNAALDLDTVGLKGSFYPTGNSKSVSQNPKAWSGLAARGHELGSHTMIHPCPEATGKSFLQPADYLEAYTVPRYREELEQSRRFLMGLGAKQPFSLAWPCGAAWVGPQREDVTGIAADQFIAARDAWGAVADPKNLDLMHVPSINGAASLASLRAWVKRARAQGGWLVIMFHGVGGDYLAVDEDVHQALVADLAADPTAWVAPFGTVAQHLKFSEKAR